MAIQSDTHCAMKNAEELIDELQPPNRRCANSADQRGGLFPQPEPFGQPNRGQRQNEQRHQPIIGECFAQYVDDSDLAGLRQIGDLLKDAFVGKER
jgi:hypothetical protein